MILRRGGAVLPRPAGTGKTARPAGFAIRLDGRLVERLHLDITRQTLALAEAIAALAPSAAGDRDRDDG